MNDIRISIKQDKHSFDMFEKTRIGTREYYDFPAELAREARKWNIIRFLSFKQSSLSL